MLEIKNFLELSSGELSEVFLARSDEINAKYLSKRPPCQNTFNLFLKYLEFNQTLSYFKVLENSKFIGVVALQKIGKNKALITIYKNPSLKNVGFLLFGVLLDLAQIKGIKVLLAKVMKANLKSIKFLQKQGFCFVKNLENNELLLEKYI